MNNDNSNSKNQVTENTNANSNTNLSDVDEMFNEKTEIMTSTAPKVESSDNKSKQKKNKSDKNDKKAKALKKHTSKKIKKIIKTVIILVILAAIVLFAAKRFGLLDKDNAAEANSLTTYTVTRRTITETIESTGTIGPNNEYAVTPLVSGEILDDYFEDGDNVFEDEQLYLVDSASGDSRITQLTNAVERVENQIEDAKESLEDLKIKSKVSGVIEEIHVEAGDDIKQGDILADVVDKETMNIDVPFFEVDINSGYVKVGMSATVNISADEHISGTVKEIAAVSNPNAYGTPIRLVTISVTNNGAISDTTTAISASVGDYTSNGGGTFEYNDNGSIYATYQGEITTIHFFEGQRIEENQIFLTLSDKDIRDQISDLESNLEDAQINLDDAKDDLDNYVIKAPKTGKVVTKNYKKGDTIYGGSSATSLALIYDMSALKFTMSIDELDIDKLEEGQEVIITSDSRQGKEYRGTITSISIIGNTSNGTTSYPVEVTIENVPDESQTTVDENGVTNKVYKTGMTSKIGTYNLTSTESTEAGTVYRFENGTEITVGYDGSIYDGIKKLKTYVDSYAAGDNFYTFADDYSTLTLEEQNTEGMLRIGMNVDAEIVVEEYVNVLAIPSVAVARGDIVKVIKSTSTDEANNESETKDTAGTDRPQMPDGERADDKSNENGEMPARPEIPGNIPVGFNPDDIPEAIPENMPTDTQEASQQPTMPKNNRDGYGTAPAESKYEEVRITTGATDGSYIEVTSGLEEGDVIIIEASDSSSGNMMFGMMGGMPAGNMGPMAGGMPAGNMGGGMPGGGMQNSGRMPGGMNR